MLDRLPIEDVRVDIVELVIVDDPAGLWEVEVLDILVIDDDKNDIVEVGREVVLVDDFDRDLELEMLEGRLVEEVDEAVVLDNEVEEGLLEGALVVIVE